jgi:predicted ATPase
LFFLGQFVQARRRLEQAITLYDPQHHRSHAFLYGHDAKVTCLSFTSLVLGLLGFPAQALEKSHEALTLARELSHPHSLALALVTAALFHQHRREKQAVRACAEEALTLSTEQGFPFYVAIGTILRGWALARQGQVTEGVAQLRQGLTAYRAAGAELARPCYLALMAEACGEAGQAGEGLTLLAEALATMHKSGERFWEAEVYRLKGELLLRPAASDASQAEASFLHALEVARLQQAKSWELRATISLSRLWQRQGKRDAARQLLAAVYNWFTEGFDTADLQEAKALLAELA